MSVTGTAKAAGVSLVPCLPSFPVPYLPLSQDDSVPCTAAEGVCREFLMAARAPRRITARPTMAFLRLSDINTVLGFICLT